MPFPTPGSLPDPGMESESLASPELARGFFTNVHLGSPVCLYTYIYTYKSIYLYIYIFGSGGVSVAKSCLTLVTHGL